VSDLTLTTTDRADIAEHADAIRRLASRSGQDIIEIGQHLIAVKERIGRGKFDAFVADEFGWSRTTAYQFIQVAESFGNRPEFGRLGPSVLYALASGDVPEEVRERFLAQANAGDPVRLADVRNATTATIVPARVVMTRRDGSQFEVDETGLMEVADMLADMETGEIVEDMPEIIGASQAQALKIKSKLDAMPPEQRTATIHQIRANEPGVLEELVDLPPLPSGPSAHERAAVLRAGTKWRTAIDDIRMRVNSVRDHGGIRETTKTWTPQGRAGLLEEVDRLIDQLTVIRDELEDFIHVA
jgi:hypothetical protein